MSFIALARLKVVLHANSHAAPPLCLSFTINTDWALSLFPQIITRNPKPDVSSGTPNQTQCCINCFSNAQCLSKDLLPGQKFIDLQWQNLSMRSLFKREIHRPEYNPPAVSQHGLKSSTAFQFLRLFLSFKYAFLFYIFFKEIRYFLQADWSACVCTLGPEQPGIARRTDVHTLSKAYWISQPDSRAEAAICFPDVPELQ